MCSLSLPLTTFKSELTKESVMASLKITEYDSVNNFFQEYSRNVKSLNFVKSHITINYINLCLNVIKLNNGTPLKLL